MPASVENFFAYNLQGTQTMQNYALSGFGGTGATFRGTDGEMHPVGHQRGKDGVYRAPGWFLGKDDKYHPQGAFVGRDGKYHPKGSFLGRDNKYHLEGSFVGRDGKYHIYGTPPGPKGDYPIKAGYHKDGTYLNQQQRAGLALLDATNAEV